MNYKFSLHELISTAESHILFICKDTNDLEFQFNQIQCQYQRAIMETRHPSCSFTLVVFQTHSSSNPSKIFPDQISVDPVRRCVEIVSGKHFNIVKRLSPGIFNFADLFSID